MDGLDIIKADYIYTGGNIYLFWGQLSDNTFFLADGDLFDVTIVNADPDLFDTADEIWQPEWQKEHLVRYADTESEGPAFVIRVIDFIKEHNKDKQYIDPYLDNIRDDAENYVGHIGWR